MREKTPVHVVTRSAPPFRRTVSSRFSAGDTDEELALPWPENKTASSAQVVVLEDHRQKAAATSTVTAARVARGKGRRGAVARPGGRKPTLLRVVSTEAGIAPLGERRRRP